MRALLWGMGFAILLTGCQPAVKAARRQAATDFDCTSRELDVIRRPGDVFVVRGCGHAGVYQCPVDVGRDYRFCVNLNQLARERAAREFECDPEAVTTEELDSFVYRVAGCEQQANYHCQVSDGRPSCVREDAAR